jgi:hypothetical protein
MSTPLFDSRLDATVRRSHGFDRIRPPELGDPAQLADYATIEPREGVDSDDLLDRAADLKVLEVGGMLTFSGFTPLVLRRPHPKIEGLRLSGGASLAAGALEMLPGLKFLQLGGALTPDLQAALPVGLEELWAHLVDIDALPRLERLKLLRTTVLEGRASQMKAIASMPSLRAIDLLCEQPMRGAKALGGLHELEFLAVNKAQGLGLKDLVACKRLRAISIGSLETLDGAEELESLESLSLGGKQCPPLAPLRHARRLAKLTIESRHPPLDLEVIGELVGLRSLDLNPGSISSTVTLKSTKMFARLSDLEVLRCFTQLADQDLTPLAGLSKLKYLCFLGSFPEPRVRWLRERLPSCKVDLTVGESPTPRAEEHLGVVVASQLEDGGWSIFEDLTELLGMDTNHDVQAAVERVLRGKARKALERIELDSERDAFNANAKSLDDLRAVAAAIESLVRARKKKRAR